MKKIAKVVTTIPIDWGGANPFIFNKVQISMSEISRSENGVIMQINDHIIVQKSYLDENEEVQTYEFESQEIRNKQMEISVEQYNTLFAGADAYLEATQPNATVFEKEKLRPNIALLLFIQNDKLDGTEHLIYLTQANEWELSNL